MLGWRLYKLDRSSTRFPQELNELLHDEKWVEQVLDLPGGELVVLVDYLDSTLDGLDRTGTSFRECLHALQKVCSSRMILPSVYEVLTTLSSNAGRTLAYGRLSNIYGGSLDGTDVAVKRLRIPTTGDRATVKQALCREAVVWKHVDHPNIVPFKGVTLESLQLVSEWMPGGELGEYIRNNQGVDLVNLLLGIAKGLDYLHSCDVIYGDLRGANILVDATGNARIVDFGHATIARDTIPPVSNTNGQVSTPRYPAPEILGDGGRCSKESDVFSFGMVMVEVFTGKIPFSNLSTAAAITSITTGDRPKRPTHPSLTDHLWALTQHCWREKPQDRPHMNELIKRLACKDPQTTITQSADTAPETRVGRSADGLHEGAEGLDPQLDLYPTPTLPRAPANCFSREEIVNEMLDLTDQVASTALFGSIGIGKSFVALTLLHHNRTKAKFGRNRHFMDCGTLTNSTEGFLVRLSDAIGIGHTMDIRRLRSHLESSPPLILLLDDVDAILDPLAPEAEEISATIEEFGSYEQVCLVTTSRMYLDIPGFHRVEVPTLSEDGAREAFYSLCNIGRSSVVDDLIARLDFHPLSIELLASSVRENGWDNVALLKTWGNGQIGPLNTSHRQALKNALEPSLRSPTIQDLGATGHDTLKAIAAFPHGVEERILGRIFTSITEVGKAADTLCRFSLIYRQDGFVKMLSPFRFYFLDSMLEPTEHQEVIRWDDDCSPAPGCRPVCTNGPPGRKPRKMKPSGSPLNVNGNRKPRFTKRQLLPFLCFAGGSIDTR